MTGKARLKFLIFLVVTAAAVPLVVTGVGLLSEFVAYFQRGADPASIFHGHELSVPDAEAAQWLDASGPYNAADAPSRPEREQIVAAYWSAWDALARAHATGDTSDLPTYWAGAAYEQALVSTNPAQRQAQTHSGHSLRLTFFSSDGSVVAFEDERFTRSFQYDDAMVTVRVSASVVMTLDQGFWRVRVLTLRYK